MKELLITAGILAGYIIIIDLTKIVITIIRKVKQWKQKKK